jgi:hypothetical protein
MSTVVEAAVESVSSNHPRFCPVRALARVVDPSLGTRLQLLRETHQKRIDREAESRLVAFMKELATFD